MHFANLNQLVAPNIRHNHVPMLIGEPGIGKSSWVEAFARDVLRSVCFTLPVNQLADKADLTGCRLVPVYEQVNDADGNPVLNSDGTPKTTIVDYEQKFFPHTVIRQAIAYAIEHPGETPVLFLDEINRTTPDVTSEALSIPTLRSIGDRKLPDNLKVIIAGNDKGNVISLDTASVSRFINYHIEPDVPTFLSVNPELNSYVASVLKKNPSLIYCKPVKLADDTDPNAQNNGQNAQAAVIEEDFDTEDAVEQFTTPRTITYVSQWLNEYNYNDLMTMMNTPIGTSNLLQEAIVSHTGNTPFTMALLAEIVNTGAVQQTASTQIIKPACFDICRNATSVDQLNAIIAGLSDAEKSQLLVFCLYDRNNNDNIIRALVPAIIQMMPNDMQTILQLNQNHKLDNGNLAALQQTGGPITQVFSMMNIF